MSISIGKKIKELRRSQDVTQEKLAEYLNLSYQAVSKWENELAYPDITLVPALANFFGVSTDELLGMKQAENNKELDEFEEIFNKNRNLGKIAENIELCRKVVEKYPRNYTWISNLASSLSIQGSKSDEDRQEIVTLCERIREDCTDNDLRNSASSLLVYNYCSLGNRTRAIEIAKEMPAIYTSRENLLSHAYEGEEKIKQEQAVLLTCIGMCEDALTTLAFNDEKLSFDEKVACHENAIKLYDIIFRGNENALFYSCYIANRYRSLARLHSINGTTKEAMEYLLCAETSARNSDKCATEGKQPYKSFLLNRQYNDPAGNSKNYEESTTELLHKFIKDNKCFENLSDHPEFVALMERLEEAK